MLSDLVIPAAAEGLSDRIQAALDAKTKPQGSLGAIEAAALRMALAQDDERPSADPARLLLFAGDHGIVAEGVSAWPSEVTAQMVMNFLAGGAASTVFARTNGVEVVVADAGVASDLPEDPALRRANIAKGTKNSAQEDAMSAEQLSAALRFGADLAAEAADAGVRTILLGEMGIGNSAAAALVAHTIEGIDLGPLTGPGAGLDAPGVDRKREILARAAARRLPDGGKLAPLDALAAYGGYEIASMAGAVIGGAAGGCAVVVDGYISTAAALAALRARPEAAEHVIFAHRSHEPGHRLMLEALEARPLLDLDLRLGEGTGALLALPLLRAACDMLRDMATFESAGVSDKDA
ncbi:nicotinate-nucleotide--dimethylbenzimidazole phosphoribosyltransferase [Rhodovulum sp. DZ06]|uniref:nicotinate-nucleotide--dimethylbenzimidazole phosphoribosyltransferase n=1 Tax=Rhodovulum sp. DZ06 TaxID=3425126 RepID=UPI003D3393E4